MSCRPVISALRGFFGSYYEIIVNERKNKI
nr:MAG TPA: apolipoprotein [Caudoviricetes sp.]